MPKVEKYIEKKRVRGTDFIVGTDKDGNAIRLSGSFFIRGIVNESNYLSLVLDEQEARTYADGLLDDKISVLGEQIDIRVSQTELLIDDLASRVVRNEYGAVQLESNIRNELYGPGGIRESYTSAITQSAEQIALSVDKKLYGPGGIEESYSSLIQQTADNINLSVSGQLNELESGVTAMVSAQIDLTSESILLEVNSRYSDLDGKVTETSSRITQLSDYIDLGVFTNGHLNAGILIERVNLYEGAIKIAADKIQIDGSTTFAPGYNPYVIQTNLEQYKIDNNNKIIDIEGDVAGVNDRVAAIIGGVDQLNTDFSSISADIEAIEEYNEGLFDRINRLANRKNTRYISPTEPVLPEGEEFLIGDEWLQEIEVPIEGSTEVEIEYKSFMWFGDDGWKPNETKINGARIETGTIDAASIITESLFSKKIGGVELDIVSGSIGGFTIDNMLVSKNEAGQGLTIDPATRSILLDDLVEGYGASRIAMTAKPLTPEALISNGGGLGFSATVDSAEYNIRMPDNEQVNSNDTRAGVSFVQYVGKAASNQAEIRSAAPAQGSGFSVSPNTSYTFDLPYSFRIYHDNQSRNGKKHKLHGSLKVHVTASLIGVNSSGGFKPLISPVTVQTEITRSTNNTDVFMRSIAFKTSFYSDDSVAVYWRLDIYLDGDLTYQQWTSQLFGHYWMTSESRGIDYRGCIPKGLSMDASVGLLELTTSGLQFAWSSDRFFRIDGPNEDYFIKSTGKWVHDGTFQINGSDIVTIDDVHSAVASDLSAYAMKSFVTDGYYDKVTSDGRFAKLAGDITQDFHVKNLNIEGQVNQWLAQQLVVEDARIQVTWKQGGAVADSGLVIFDKDTSAEVSALVYDVDGIWRAGGNRLFTEAYNPKLGGYVAGDYPRKAENAVVTGAWTFTSDVKLPTGSIDIGVRNGDGIRFRNSDNFKIYFSQSSDAALGGNLAGTADFNMYFKTSGGNRGWAFKYDNNIVAQIQGNGSLSVTGAITAGGNVGTSNFVSQMQGWRVTPQGQADFRHIFTDELQAKAFTADISQALVGSDVLTKSVAKLAQNWAATANGATSTIYVEELEGFPDFQVFAVGDRLLLRLFDRAGGGLLIKNIWATVASYVSTTKNVQRYTITVNSGGAAGHTVYAGSMILDYGTPGSGVIERTVLDQQGSPYSRVSTWTGSPDNPANYTLHYQSGNLNGISNAEGWGVYSENSFLTGKLLVGDLTKAGQYMEYASGQLNIKGQITVTGGNAATKADVDAVQVGGRNLLRNTAKFISLTPWVPNATAGSITVAPNVDGEPAVLFAATQSGMYQSVPVANLIDGGTYTISFWAKSVGSSSQVRIGFLNQVGMVGILNIAGGWTVYKYTFTAPMDTSKNTYLHVYSTPVTGDGFYLKNIKLELGTRTTDWTPAPEDVPSALEYLAEAIQDGTTDIEGGLVSTNVLMVKDTNGAVRGGISGLKSDNVGFWTGGSYQGAVNGSANVLFRKDGSFSLAGGKISGTAAGALTIDGGVVTGNIQSSNYDSTTGAGSRFDLTNGGLQIGGAIRLDPYTSELIVKNRAEGQEIIRVGDFNLSNLAALTYDFNKLFSSTNATLSPSAGAFSINGSVYADAIVRPEILLRSSTSTQYYLVNDLVAGNNYSLHVSGLRLRLTINANVTILDYPYPYLGFSGGYVRVQAKNGSTVIHESTYHITSDGIIDLDAFSTHFLSTSSTIQLVITPIGDFYHHAAGAGITTVRSNCNLALERRISTAFAELKSLTNSIELSTRGFQVAFSSNNYQKMKSTGFETRASQTYTSPNGLYGLQITDTGVFIKRNGGAWTPL